MLIDEPYDVSSPITDKNKGFQDTIKKNKPTLLIKLENIEKETMR